MTSSASRRSVRYLRGHLAGASGGLQLARMVAADPWTDHALDHLPDELEAEIVFVREWARDVAGGSQRWVTPALGVAGALRSAASPLRLHRGRFGRVVALEAMRSLLFAKKAMWELGMEECLADGPHTDRLHALDEQASRQAVELQVLHRRAATEAFR